MKIMKYYVLLGTSESKIQDVLSSITRMNITAELVVKTPTNTYIEIHVDDDITLNNVLLIGVTMGRLLS